MKALSLTQPMAWAIFQGKDVENRPWNTYYRGSLLIHASKGFNKEHYDWIASNENRLFCFLPQPYELVHGALIGVVNLVRVMRKDGDNYNPKSILSIQGGLFSMRDGQYESKCRSHDKAWCSHWFFGPYGFVLEDAEEFDTPIPYRGSLNLFDVPDEIIKEAIEQK